MSTATLSRPLASVLLRRLLMVYVAFAAAMIGLQMLFEYRAVRQEIQASMRALAATFAPGAESALREYQQSLLDSMTSGIGTHRYVVEVEIRDRAGSLGSTWRRSEAIQASPDLQAETLLHRKDGEGKTPAGYLRVASGDAVVRDFLRNRLMQVASATALQIIFFGLVLWLFVRRLVVKPLRDFSAQVGRLTGNEQGLPPSPTPAEVAEIDALRQGFNRLMEQLAQSHGRIAEQNVDLEQRVQDRTRELRDEEALSRSIFETATLGIALIKDRVILKCNRSLEEIFGYGPGELFGQSTRIWYLDEESYLAGGQIYAALARGETHRRAEHVRRKDGSIFWCRLSGRAIAPGDMAQGSVWIIEDITREREIAEEMSRARASAEAANRAKSEFLANMSHEIRTPMNAIMGLTQLVLESELKPDQEDFLRKSYASSRALLGILNDILDYSKIEAGRLDIHQSPLNIETVLREVVDLFELRIDEKGLLLRLDILPEAPPIVLGDELRLKQVLNNLLSNAIKFTEHGEIRLQVELAQRMGDSLRLRFAVRDSGIGMTKEQAERLFQPFAQADGSITRKYGGTGLGLAICSRLVGLMGGDIAVTTTPGTGATFTFTVVVGIAEEKKALPASQQPGRISALAGRCFDGARILLAEDNPTNQLVARKLLERNGAKVTVAHHGAEAVNLAGRESFDLVLMDLHMPVMDGIEAARRIHSLPAGQGLPIIAMTAAVLQEDRERCREAGMVDFIAKPVDNDELAKVLSRYLETIDCAPPPKVAAGPLPQLPGLDLGPALRRLDGDSELLFRLLCDFGRSYADILAEVDQLLAAGDWMQAAVQLHSLKGVAGNLGMADLASSAARWEQDVRAGRGAEARPEFADVLRRTLEAVSRLDAAVATQVSSDTKQQAPLAVELLQELHACLLRREWLPDSLSADIQQKAKSCGPESPLRQLVVQLDRLDYEAACATVVELANRQGVKLTP